MLRGEIRRPSLDSTAKAKDLADIHIPEVVVVWASAPSWSLGHAYTVHLAADFSTVR